jgi:ribose transport system permease protein
MRIRSAAINFGFDRFSGFYLLASFILVFGLWTPSLFLTMSTLHSIASEQAIAGLLALAVLVPICAGQYDLSVGANANLAGITATLLQVQLHWNVGLALVVSVAVGIVIGLVNAAIVILLRVNSFIATLGMTSVLSAVLTIVSSDQQPAPVVSSVWNDLTQKTVGGFQVVVLFLFVVAFIVWWLLDWTPIGRYIRATGANPDAARLSGVRVGRWSALSLVISGGIAGMAGILFTSLTGPSLSFGSTLLLPAFAAVFLGSTQIHPGRFNVWGTILAIYVLATGVQGLEFVSGVQWLSDMFNGLALIIAVALSVSPGPLARLKSRRQLTGGKSSDLVASKEVLASRPGSNPDDQFLQLLSKVETAPGENRNGH